jgi:hypothetical protein
MNLYRFLWENYKDGNIECLFLADQTEIDALIGKRVAFGDVLGRNSDVAGIIEKDDFTRIPLSDTTIAELLLVFPDKVLSGYFPQEDEYYEEWI